VGLGDRGPGGIQTGPDGVVTDENASTHCCLVAIGRLQVTSTPNSSDLAGSNSNSGKYHFINNLIKSFGYCTQDVAKFAMCQDATR